MKNIERNETIWFLMEYFSEAVSDLIEGESVTADSFLASFERLTQDLDEKQTEVLKRGLFLILKSSIFRGEKKVTKFN